MVLAEVSPSGDGGVAAGVAETEVARIFEILEAKRGGKSLVTAFGDEQLAVVAEAMVGDATSAAHLESMNMTSSGAPVLDRLASSLRCGLHSRLQSPRVTVEDLSTNLLRDRSWALVQL